MDLYSQEMQEKKKYLQNQHQAIKITAIGTYISIITLNVNGLNALTKRHRLAEWIHIYVVYKKPNSDLKTYRLKVRGWKNIFHANGNQKKAVVAILISDKIDLKIKKITRNKEGHYIMIKGSIQEEDITIVNIYAPSRGAPQYIRQTLTDIKGEMESNTIIIGDFNNPLTVMYRSSKQKINKETQVLNDTLDEMDLIDIFRTFHPNVEYTPSSQEHM